MSLKQITPCIIALFVMLQTSAKSDYKIETSDIDRFWQAYDDLSAAQSLSDSIRIFQTQYIDEASDGFKSFLRLRKFTAEEYVGVVRKYPAFWESIRANTLHVKNRKSEIEYLMQTFANIIPGFKPPDICFAIGTLRTGGTTTLHKILIGTEIAAADSTTNTSEFSGWLLSVIGNTGDIVAMIAHEAVHTQQSILLKSNLLSQSIKEGTADFITQHFFHLNINANIYRYGNANRCALWNEFEPVMYEKDFNNWLYNGNNAEDRPADLGYFMGAEIARAYYTNTQDSVKAIKTLLKSGKYKQVFEQSNYMPCNN